MFHFSSIMRSKHKAVYVKAKKISTQLNPLLSKFCQVDLIFFSHAIKTHIICRKVYVKAKYKTKKNQPNLTHQYTKKNIV